LKTKDEREISDRKETRKGKNFILSAIGSAIVIAVVEWLWPSVIPLDVFGFWRVRGGPADWLAGCWPAFAWAAGVTALVAFTTRNSARYNRYAEKILCNGFQVSLAAGVLEEICFRWLIFLGAIVGVKVANFLFFGFIGFGVPEWFFLHVFGPLADFTTLGGLGPYLFHPAGWAVGAAMLSANAGFRDGHKYLGFVGYLNSWFMGMYFFWIMFTFGLPIAIAAHFIYDMLIFIVRYVDAAIERAQGNA
jgi:hypothetical protein